MKKEKNYKPGQIVTLKDGKIYRASKKTITCSLVESEACVSCKEYYRSLNLNAPCKETGEKSPFGKKYYYENVYMCNDLFGYLFPKLILPKSSIPSPL